jgi:hypothetical protein
MFNGRRQPSCDGTSRMTRECQVRICERLGVKFPGPTRQKRWTKAGSGFVRCPLYPPKSGHRSGHSRRQLFANAAIAPSRVTA